MNSINFISAVDAAIFTATQNGTLRVTESFNARLGSRYWAIEDGRGLIAVALSEAEAREIIARATK